MEGDARKEAERLLDALDERLVLTLDPQGLGAPSKLPFKVASLCEAALHRSTDLVRAALTCFDHGSALPAVILTRALLETSALLFRVRELVDATCETGSLPEALDDQLMALLFGGRVQDSPKRATNVLTLFDKLDRTFEGVREWYDQLSELAHPNSLGLLGSYCELVEGHFVLTLGPNENYRAMGSGCGLPALCTGARMALHFADGIAMRMDEFSGVCHKTAKMPPPL